GVFVFDVWNGLAVVAQRPGDRTLKVQKGTTEIVRTTRAELDMDKQICHVRFNLRLAEPDGSKKSTDEHHVMRYFFPAELTAVLAKSGMQILEYTRFPEGDLPADENAWNMIVAARAV